MRWLIFHGATAPAALRFVVSLGEPIAVSQAAGKVGVQLGGPGMADAAWVLERHPQYVRRHLGATFTFDHDPQLDANARTVRAGRIYA